MSSARNLRRHCTNFRHSLVDSVHSVENARVTVRDFRLTKKPPAGKNILVLWQLLKFFRLVRRPGLKRSHPVHANDQGGRARVNSQALVEKNKKKRRRQDRVPRRWVGFSGWR
jgi:hypothetical protein